MALLMSTQRYLFSRCLVDLYNGIWHRLIFISDVELISLMIKEALSHMWYFADLWVYNLNSPFY